MPANVRRKPLTEKMRVRLETAAELRSAGSSWATVANKLGCSAVRCRHWPIEYPCEWESVYLPFKRQHFAEVAIEARILLHKVMRETKDDRLRLAAIRVVLHLDGKMCEPFEKLLHDLSQDQEALRMAQYYLSLDDATRKKLLEEMLRQCVAAARAEQPVEPAGLLTGPETAVGAERQQDAMPQPGASPLEARSEPQRGVIPQPGASPLEACSEPQRGVMRQPGASPLEEGRNLHL